MQGWGGNDAFLERSKGLPLVVQAPRQSGARPSASEKFIAKLLSSEHASRIVELDIFLSLDPTGSFWLDASLPTLRRLILSRPNRYGRDLTPTSLCQGATPHLRSLLLEHTFSWLPLPLSGLTRLCLCPGYVHRESAEQWYNALFAFLAGCSTLVELVLDLLPACPSTTLPTLPTRLDSLQRLAIAHSAPDEAAALLARFRLPAQAVVRVLDVDGVSDLLAAQVRARTPHTVRLAAAPAPRRSAYVFAGAQGTLRVDESGAASRAWLAALPLPRLRELWVSVAGDALRPADVRATLDAAVALQTLRVLEEPGAQTAARTGFVHGLCELLASPGDEDLPVLCPGLSTLHVHTARDRLHALADVLERLVTTRTEYGYPLHALVVSTPPAAAGAGALKLEDAEAEWAKIQERLDAYVDAIEFRPSCVPSPAGLEIPRTCPRPEFEDYWRDW